MKRSLAVGALAATIPLVAVAQTALDGGGSSWTLRVRSAVGLLLILALGVALSRARRAIAWRLVAAGLVLQVTLGALALSGPGRAFFGVVNRGVTELLAYTEAGSGFVFGELARQNSFPVGASVVPSDAPGFAQQAPMAPVQKEAQPARWVHLGAYFAFGVLPTIIFFSSLMAVLYHLGIMQRFVRAFAWLMERTMKTSGAETLSAAGNVFVGQTEAPLLVRPFLSKMTESELMTVMTGGFATVAGGVMLAYTGMLRAVFPDIAGHLLCASVMSAPAALVMGKMLIPEPDPTKCATHGGGALSLPSEHANIVDAAATGAGDGLKLALNVGAMVLAFLGLIALLNGITGGLGAWVGIENLSLERILGWLLRPVAWLLGVEWEDAGVVGALLGVRTIVNEFVSYQQLAELGATLKPRSMVITSYALCGFANIGSIAIQIGGIATIAPERRADLARIGPLAMVAGTLAAFMTACVIGILT